MVEILKLALPISAQSFIAVGMNMADTLMLNEMGQAQISAASFAGQITTFFLILAMGLAMGAGVLTNRYWGRGDICRLKQTATLLLRWELCLTVAVTLGVLLWSEQLMGLFTEDGEIIARGVVYLRLLLPAWLAMALSQSCAIILRSAGKLTVPLLASLMGLGFNVLLNRLLIPSLEIAGAAIATSAAWTVQALVTCGYFFLAEGDIAYRFRDLRLPTKGLYADYLPITLPVLVSDGLLGLGVSVMTMVMGRMGADTAAANSVTMVVQQMSTVLHHGVAGAAGILIGHSLGRGEPDTAMAQGRTLAGWGVAIGLVAAGIIFALRRPVIARYDISPAAADIAGQLITGLLWTVVLQSLSGVLTKGVLRAGGDTRFLMVADVLFLWVLAIPLGIFAAWRQAGALWVFLLLRADIPLKCLWCLWRLHSGKWIKRVS